MKFSAFFLASAALLPFSGCAKSPSGGGVVNNAPNRLQVTLNLKGTLSTRAYYAVAFDEGSSQGPRAILSGSRRSDVVVPLNGVVGGTFRFAVIYEAGVFTVYRRPNPASPNLEIVERTNLPFVSGQLPRASANAISFTLDLDARDSQNNFYFSHDLNGQFVPTQLRLNAFGTVRPSAQDERIRPVDALGGAPALTSTPETFQVGAARRATLNDDFGAADRQTNPEPHPSFDNTSDPNYVNFNSLDIASLDLNLVRG